MTQATLVDTAQNAIKNEAKHVSVDPLQTPECLRRTKVILVEDNDDFRALICAQLEKLGCTIQSAANAGAFLSSIAATRDAFDLAVVDFQLPDLRGDYLVSWLAESELEAVNSLPILFVTGHPDALPNTLTTESRRIAVLPKPYRFEDLKGALDRLLTAPSEV